MHQDFSPIKSGVKNYNISGIHRFFKERASSDASDIRLHLNWVYHNSTNTSVIKNKNPAFLSEVVFSIENKSLIIWVMTEFMNI